MVRAALGDWNLPHLHRSFSSATYAELFAVPQQGWLF